MKKNIVLIRTVENTGTGILYPCQYEKTIVGCKSYIIFTNRHILDDFGRDRKNEDMKNFIILQMYDDSGRLIEMNRIKRVLAHNPSYDNNKHNDVAALLVDIDECISITLQKRIYEKELEDRSILYMEGYPGVMLDDDISQKVQLQGMVKTIFPCNPYIGIYQICDEYHWYNNYMDLKLLEGFSGSPVYRYEGKTAFLVGMNQSVSDIDNGENPFKLVYYLRMKHVLECLRKTGCILFRCLQGNEYQIEWIYGLEEEIASYKNEPSFLLIGGSGAGKSSFAKDFALNGNKLCSVNDGQTTRTNVIYEYSLSCKDSEAEIRILTQKDFQQRMEGFYGILPMLYFFKEIFGFGTEPSRREPLNYLRNMYYLLKCCVGEKSEAQWLSSMENAILLNDALDPDILWDVYERANAVLLNHVPLRQVKYICDREKIQMVYRRYKEETAYHKFAEAEHGIGIEQFGKMVREEWEGDIDAGLLKALYDKCACEEFDYKGYQTECYEALNVEEKVKEDNKKQVWKFWQDVDFKKKVFHCILKIEGFFDINEFPFSGMEEKVTKILKELKLEEQEEEGQGQEGRKDDNQGKESGRIPAVSVRKAAEELCSALHIMIKEKLSGVFPDLRNNNLTVKYDLNKMSAKDQESLALCLQKKGDKSLTGILKSLKIRDAVSNEYALLLKELKIKRLRMLDTYGLDHVEWGNSAEEVLHDIRYRYEEEENIRIEDMGILYLKKLASGRPEELRMVLPCIYEVMPQAPIYCVFSGIDIFYANQPAQIENIQWKKEHENFCPKAVRYILSDEGEDEITRNVKCRPERKRNYYLVLRNNLFPYCGKKELVQTEYIYYHNNLKYARKVISSLIMKEYSSLEIVDIGKVEGVLKKKSANACLEELLGEVFERASVRFWNYYHPMTVKANFRRVAENDEDKFVLGYWGVKRQRWHQLFHEAYRGVISQKGSKFIALFDGGEDAIEAAMLNMETDYLGVASDLYKGELREDRKNEFRKILEDMYGEGAYEYNPFKESEEKRELFLSGSWTQKQKREYLRDVFDFAKGFRSSEDIRRRYRELFEKKLVERLEMENKSKAEKLIELNIDFSEALNKLKKEFYVMSGEKSESMEMRFRQILRYYLDL